MSLWEMKRSDDGYGYEEVVGQYEFDARHPLCAYFYGLALSDGSIRQNDRRSGALSIELNARDDWPLWYFWETFPWRSRVTERERTSPYDPNKISRTAAYVSHAGDLREQMISLGFPVGSKARTCAPPSGDYDAKAFWRGFVDGDGSIGVTAQGVPFISLVTVSDPIAAAFSDLVGALTGRRPLVNPNKRDGARNIMVSRERAITLARFLYAKGGPQHVSIPRKQAKAASIMAGDWEADAPWRKRRVAVEPQADSVVA